MLHLEPQVSSPLQNSSLWLSQGVDETEVMEDLGMEGLRSMRAFKPGGSSRRQRSSRSTIEAILHSVQRPTVSRGVTCHKVSLSSNQEDIVTTQGQEDIVQILLYSQGPHPSTGPLTSCDFGYQLSAQPHQPSRVKHHTAGISSGGEGEYSPLGIRTPVSSQTTNTPRQPDGTTETLVPGSLLSGC